jgi:hypothetical protein
MIKIPPRDTLVVPTELIVPKLKEAAAKVAENYVVPLKHFSRSPKSTSITVGPTPKLIIAPPHEWPYLIQNPAVEVLPGATTMTVFSGTVSSSGNSDASPVGVSGILKAHLHIYVSSVTGTWDIHARTRSPITGNFIATQVLWSGINAAMEGYAFPGEYGIATDFSIGWDMTSAGSMTFTVILTAKEAIASTTAGLSRVVYIGGPDVNPKNGYKLPPGGELHFKLSHDVVLYAMCEVDTEIVIFRT